MKYVFIWIWLSSPLWAENKVKKEEKQTEKQKPQPEKEPPIEFEGEELQGTRKDGFLELLKNVKIVQGDFDLKADKAQMFFHPESEEIEKFLAFGSVKMNTIDDKTKEKVYAEGEMAEFHPKSNLLILKERAILIRGKDKMNGQTIEYNRQTGWMKGSKVQGKVESK